MPYKKWPLASVYLKSLLLLLKFKFLFFSWFDIFEGHLNSLQNDSEKVHGEDDHGED